MINTPAQDDLQGSNPSRISPAATLAIFRHLALGVALVLALTTTASAAQRIKVSTNKRFLVRDDGSPEGKPFFWLGDTAWELFHRLNQKDTEAYLKDRAQKGYTVIQAVALAELDGLGDPNANGDKPLVDNDPTKPNEAYWKHVDWVVQKANSLGLVIGMLPTWGDKWNKKWGKGPEIFNVKNAEIYGAWLGARYKDADLVWILGGDRPFENDNHKAIIAAMAKGVRAGDGGAHLITVHPVGGQGSAEVFHNEDWLDFNMRQNGHVAEFDRYAKTKEDYDRTPVKPVLDGEPIYEDHPVSFKAPEFGHSIAADVRRPLYWDLFSGAFGHTYGHHSVWQMWSEGRTPVNKPLMPWSEALAAPGAGQMQHGRWLIESRPFLSRIPDDSVIVTGQIPTSVPGAGRYRFVATRDSEGSYAMIYAPVGRTFSVRMDAVKAKSVKAWWFDPRTGKAQAIGVFPATGEKSFTPPQTGEQMDYVLVLDDAAKNYPPPGTRKRGK